MKTIQISDQDYDFLKDIIHELNTQDERFTRNPVFLVQELNKVPTSEDYFTDGVQYVEDVTGDHAVYETLIEAYRDLLESGYSKDDIRENVETVPYVESWQTIKTCFTEKGAQQFIDRKKHDYNTLRIYVDSLGYNIEMLTLRNLILNLTFVD